MITPETWMGSLRGSSSTPCAKEASDLISAAVTAGLMKEGDEWHCTANPKDQALHFGPYVIPKSRVLAGVPSMIVFMLQARAQRDIAKQLADKPTQDVIMYGTHSDTQIAIDPDELDANATKLYTLERLADRDIMANNRKMEHLASVAPESDGLFVDASGKGVNSNSAIQTYKGMFFDVANPTPDLIDIEDVAHALSLVNRYTGHTRVAYSVAEHSVRVLWAVDCMLDKVPGACTMEQMARKPRLEAERDAILLAALLHDGSEAYLSDLARPIKTIPAMQPYRDLERKLEEAVAKKWGLTFPWHPIIKRADNVLLATEKRDLMSEPPTPWNLTEEPLPLTIKPWPAELAEYRFLEEFKALTRRLGCHLKSR